MKLKSFVYILVGVILFSACQNKEEATTELKTQKEKASYIIGYDIGKNTSKRKMDIDIKAMNKGIEDALAGKDPEMDDAEMSKVMEMYEIDRQKKVEVSLKEQGELNKVEGEKFLAIHKNEEGIFTFKTGVQMKVLKEGTGRKATLQDVVVIHVIGKFLDGTQFDNSYERGEPIEYPVMQLLPGQQQLLVEMNEGAKAIGWIPPNMAFGNIGGGELIPPNTTLIYEIELVKIKTKK